MSTVGAGSAVAVGGRVAGASDLVGFRTSDGVVLAVDDRGPADPSATVLLIHGWTLDHTMWSDVMDRLVGARNDLRVVAYDHRGHGWSDAGPAGTDLGRIADDLAELIEDRCGSGPVVLAGHSLGGMAMMALYERHPDLATRVVAGNLLVATTAGASQPAAPGIPSWLGGPALRLQHALWRRQESSDAAVTATDPRWIAAALRFAPGPQPDWSRHDRDRTAAMVARSHPATTAAVGRAILAHDRIAALEAMGAVPTVVLAGGKDVLCPVADARRMAAAAPGAELVVFSRAGHMLPYERRDQVAAHVARIVDRALGADGRSAA